jgi:predicted permease
VACGVHEEAGMERFRLDLRYALRTLRKSPGFAAVAVLSLALGIGANTAIFSLIHAVMLRVLPVAHPEQLVLMTDPAVAGVASESAEQGERTLLAYQEFDALRAAHTGLRGLFAADSSFTDVDARIEQIRVKARSQLVSGEFFGLLGVRPVLGRAFTPEEDRVPGANPVAVISYGFWKRQFARDSAVLDKTILVGNSGFRIVGVAPPDFHGFLVGWDIDVWFPLTMQAQLLPGHDYLTPRDTLWLQVGGRLAPGMSRQTAQAGLNVAFHQILRGWAGSLPTESERKAMLDQKLVLKDGGRGASPVREQFGDPLMLMMAMVGVVLLIACANVANLTLARATGRQREIGVRLALGAGRSGLVRQLLTESLLLALAGGALGALLAIWGADLVIAMVSDAANGIALEGQRDAGVFVFTACASLLTAVAFGLAPALRATRVEVHRMLASGTRGALGSRAMARSGRVVVAGQVALSLLLLVGAALCVRSLHALMTQNVGFDRDHVVMARLDPAAAGYRGAPAEALYRQLIERVRSIPGVRDATISNSGLFSGNSADQIRLDVPTSAKGEDLHSNWTLIGPNYFRTLGIPLRRGRELNDADAARGAAVCVVNETFARFYFGNADPLGRHVTDEYPTTIMTYEIVGVAADARETSLSGKQERRFYANLSRPIGKVESVALLARTSGDPARLVNAIREAVNDLNPVLPVLSVRTIHEQMGRRLVAKQLIAELAAFFGALALIMAAVGLYGVMSYSISRRTSEIGLRMALGASQGDVLAMVLRETLVLVAVGMAIGLAGALAAGRFLQSALTGVAASDPASIALAVVIIAAAAVFAGYVPARRAARIDPMNALRCD